MGGEPSSKEGKNKKILKRITISLEFFFSSEGVIWTRF